MNAREIFVKVKNHLLAQNQRSVTAGDGLCAYRGDNGLMCAVGCLIPDDHYDPKFEGTYVLSNQLRPVLKALGILDGAQYDTAEYEKSADLLERLQSLHDDVDPKNWPQELAALERMFEL